MANLSVREALAGQALNQTTINNLPSLSTATEQVATFSLLKYVISCALKDTRTLTSKANDVWKGELGLCDDWFNDPPGQECQELVSACVLARVNALGKRVIISVRGEPTGLFLTQPKVPIETMLRDHTAIQSLASCAGITPTPGDPTRDCGWQPLY